MNFPVTEFQGKLKRSGKVTLDANGNGVIDFSPTNARQRWEVTGVVVSTDQGQTTTPVPVAEVLVNGVSYGQITVTSTGQSLGATWSGSQDTFSGTAEMGPCDNLSVSFTGGIPGTIAFANILGSFFTRTA
ncbi:MAG: hypothetical protein ACREHG_05985 [Candidatus Saccharimonadales bacterium]